VLTPCGLSSLAILEFVQEIFCSPAFTSEILLAPLSDNGADLRVLELEVVLEFIYVHNAGNGDPVPLQNEVLLVEVDPRDQRPKIGARLGDGNRRNHR
jgi:hypothetical protein